jgi:CRP-like cAMP-binding protein
MVYTTLLTAGGFFGEAELMTNEPRKERFVVDSPRCHLLVLGKNEFFEGYYPYQRSGYP